MNKLTFAELLKLARYLKSQGNTRGDRLRILFGLIQGAQFYYVEDKDGNTPTN